MNRQCKLKISISPKTLHWIYDWMKIARMLLPHMSKISQVVWTTLQIAAKDSEFHPSFMNLQRNCRRPCQQLQTMNLQASSSTQTALIVLTTAGRSMHYFALSQIHLRHICVATAWEQLLGSFCSYCFHNTAALDNSMSTNCRTSRPRYKRPTSYLCGIARFISTIIASSQLKSNVLSHPEFWNSHVENVLWIWHRALHCAYSQRNPKNLVRKGRGYWPTQVGRGTTGEGWQQNNKCWSHH